MFFVVGCCSYHPLLLFFIRVAYFGIDAIKEEHALNAVWVGWCRCVCIYIPVKGIYVYSEGGHSVQHDPLETLHDNVFHAFLHIYIFLLCFCIVCDCRMRAVYQ